MTIDISEYVKGDLVLEAYVKTVHKIIKDLEDVNKAQRVELEKLKADIEEQNEVMLETGLMYEEAGKLYYA